MIYEQLDALLHALEEELRALSLWEHDMPSFEQLSSTEPFMIDTLDLHQWLQWVLIPRLRQAISDQAALPEKCAIAPVAEMFYEGASFDASRLCKILARIDHLLSHA